MSNLHKYAHMYVLIMHMYAGKGPLKKYYEEIIEGKKFSHVQIYTMWLSAEDYPVLIGTYIRIYKKLQ